MYSLDEVLDQLDRYHQRATYGAVGKLVDAAMADSPHSGRAGTATAANRGISLPPSPPADRSNNVTPPAVDQ